jgi:K+-transporting ATPase c subunit
MQSLRANLLLPVFTLGICCVLYPAVLYAVGRGLFPSTVSGSLVEDGRGSRLIAQPFTGEEYFWPRPSAVSYNAAAAGGSNWGANNPKLRDRVCQQLGPMVVYRAGSQSAGPDHGNPRTPQQDIEAWFAAKPDRAAEHTNFFDLWLSDPANAAKVADLEPVVADMVMASGSGLDPHITVRNALSVYQLDRVAKKRAASTAEFERVRREIADLVRAKSFTPLGGLVGEPLVNVLDLNLELDANHPVPARATGK